jgi:DNA-binding SARP family transcriptional activator/tetratricopeptide (TPR) repeat protein
MPAKVFRVNLLGDFSLAYGDQPIASINTVRLQSLLVYLILHADTPQPRQHIAFLLWPDTFESNARNNLRQFLHQLRQALPTPDRFLSVNAHTLRWQIDNDQLIDVRRFENALTEATAAEQQADWNDAQHWLKEALSIYRSDLLPGCYDEWITPERDRLRQQSLAAHHKLVHLLEQQRDYPEALQVAQSRLRLDPLDESTHVTLMRLHDLNHDRPAARRVYQTAVETLRRELNVEPGEALQKTYERVQRAPDSRSTDRATDSFQLVGRQSEWQQLQFSWQRAAYGDALLVLITGEAGIGKSRLAEELFRWAEQQSFTVARTRSYAAEGRLSFAPAAEWLRNAAIRPHVTALDNVWLTEITRLLPELLSERADLAQPEPISEYGQRQRFFEALARAILAAPSPILLWIDDLQWCDLETLEWLHFLLRFRPHHPLLVLGTARSEETPPDHPVVKLARQLRAESKLTAIELAPLDAAETARLASQIQGHELSVAASVSLYHETEGNPLFVVETVRANSGSTFVAGVRQATDLDEESHVLPARVYAVIARRLSQLSSAARKTAELGAVIGRAFTLDVLLHAEHDGEDSVVQALDELWQKRIVREQSANLFDFTHDKLREVAYAEISMPQRRLLHRHIAQALELVHADQLDPVSAQIAAHYEQAALFEQAVPHYERAGKLAASVYANDDAINLLTRALALLAHLPGSVMRHTQELNLQLTLAVLHRITKGWASPEVEQVMQRAMVLSDQFGDEQQQIRALFALTTLYVVQARFEQVEHTYRRIEQIFRQAGNTPPPFTSIYVAGAKLSLGQIAEATTLFDQVVAVRDARHIRDLQESQGLNYLVHGLAWKSHAHWCQGYPHSALKEARAAVKFAQEFEQPFNQALAITYLALLQEWSTDTGTFRAHAEDAYVRAREYEAPYYQAWARILVSFAQADRQADAANLTHLRDAIRAFTETGAHLRLPIYYSQLARAYQRAGQFDDGLAALELAFAESQQTKEHWWDAELHRLRGELIWAQGATAAEVEAAFRSSIEIAQAQQAKSLELRAATSLARLWQATGRSGAVKQLLVPLYGWFTEGFDTPDLQAAQSLIA